MKKISYKENIKSLRDNVQFKKQQQKTPGKFYYFKSNYTIEFWWRIKYHKESGIKTRIWETKTWS